MADFWVEYVLLANAKLPKIIQKLGTLELFYGELFSASAFALAAVGTCRKSMFSLGASAARAA